MKNKRLIIGITGASGAIYGIRLLEMLQELPVETYVILSKAAHITIKEETTFSVSDVKALASHAYQVDDIAAAVSSGSFLTDGMIVVPCSVKTMSEIAYGLTSNLISRAADVTLKERRKLILMFRETPLNLSHIESMRRVTEMGGIIAPPVPAFYNNPTTLDDIVTHSLGRVLDLVGIESNSVTRWKS
jgi:4-hydroxy-3-polyprenylbenzoate decarboxylase